MMSELEKLKAGQIYCCMDKEVAGLKENALRLCRQFNTTDPMDTKTQQKIIKELFGATS